MNCCKACLLLLVATFSSAALSGVVSQGELKVSNVMAGYATGEIYFAVDNTPVNSANCSNTSENNMVLIVDPDKSDVSLVLSILLTANTIDKEIDIQVYDDACKNGYAVIRRVKI